MSIECPFPIPPIGLQCPYCRYELTGLTRPRCPECGRAFDLSEIFRAAVDHNAAAREAILRETLGSLAENAEHRIRDLAFQMGLTLTSAAGILAQEALDRATGFQTSPADFKHLYDGLAQGRSLLVTLPRPPRELGVDFEFPDCDLPCPNCGAELIGVRHDTCAACGESFEPADLLPRHTLVALTRGLRKSQPFRVMLMRTTLETEGIPNAAAQPATAMTTVAGIGMAVLRVPRSYYFDATAFLNEQKGAAGDDTWDDEHGGGEGAWMCPRCQEYVPGNFEVCWSCGQPPPAERK